MADLKRRFDPVSVSIDGDETKRRRVHRVECCECGTVHDVSANTYSGARAHEYLMKIFQRGGWEISRRGS